LLDPVEFLLNLGIYIYIYIYAKITNGPRYVTNQTVHDDLKYLSSRMIYKKSTYHHDKLGNHSNPILQPILEQQQRRRLKELWSSDLIDG
jgi:hypothetical protein